MGYITTGSSLNATKVDELLSYDEDDGQLRGLAYQNNRSSMVLTCVLLLSLSLFAGMGNILVMLVIQRSRRVQSTTNFFIMSLAVGDVALLVLVTPFVVARLLSTSGTSSSNAWRAGDALCRLVRFLQLTCSSSTVLVLIGVCMDRFYTILYPLSFKVTRGTAKRLILAAWITAAVSSYPELHLSQETQVAALPFKNLILDEPYGETTSSEAPSPVRLVVLTVCPTFILSRTWFGILYSVFIVFAHYICPATALLVGYSRIFYHVRTVLHHARHCVRDTGTVTNPSVPNVCCGGLPEDYNAHCPDSNPRSHNYRTITMSSDATRNHHQISQLANLHDNGCVTDTKYSQNNNNIGCGGGNNHSSGDQDNPISSLHSPNNPASLTDSLQRTQTNNPASLTDSLHRTQANNPASLTDSLHRTQTNNPASLTDSLHRTQTNNPASLTDSLHRTQTNNPASLTDSLHRAQTNNSVSHTDSLQRTQTQQFTGVSLTQRVHRVCRASHYHKPVPRNKVKMVRMLSWLTCVTLLLHFPYYTSQTVYTIDSKRLLSADAYIVSFILLVISAALKPVIYACGNTNFRRGCKETLCMSTFHCYRFNDYIVTSASAVSRRNYVGVMNVTSHLEQQEGNARNSPGMAFNRAKVMNQTAWPVGGSSLPSSYL